MPACQPGEPPSDRLIGIRGQAASYENLPLHGLDSHAKDPMTYQKIVWYPFMISRIQTLFKLSQFAGIDHKIHPNRFSDLSNAIVVFKKSHFRFGR